MADKKRSKELENALVEHVQSGMTYTQACKHCDVGYRQVNRWRDKDPEFHQRMLRAYSLGSIILNDSVISRYEEVLEGTRTWNKDQVAAMRDFAQHVRWLSSKMYPRLYGDKGVAQIEKNNGITQISWIRTGQSSEEALPGIDVEDTSDQLLIDSKAG